ncbi:MAG: hypothetical protein N3I35_09395 [Clostridia bacterium]|nr:hypothetical protein [Clostridia bacterium]
MEYIHKLPFMLGSLMAIIIGLISYKYHVSQQEIYIRIAISMVVFFFIGTYIRNTIMKILDETAKKREAEELERQAELEQQMQEQLKASEENKKTSKLDLKVDDSYDSNSVFGEDFAPLTVKEILRSNNES